MQFRRPDGGDYQRFCSNYGEESDYRLRLFESFYRRWSSSRWRSIILGIISRLPWWEHGFLQRSVSRLRSEEKDRKTESSVVSSNKRELLCLFLLGSRKFNIFFAYSRGNEHPCRGTALLKNLVLPCVKFYDAQ